MSTSKHAPHNDGHIVAVDAIPNPPQLISWERIHDLQSECFADDVPVSEAMHSWTEARLIEFFESGGQTSPLKRDATHPITHITAKLINLPARADRRRAFLSRWCGNTPLTVTEAVDGRSLLTSHGVPPPPEDCPRHVTHGLRACWRDMLCTHERDWGPQQPRKLAAVVGCHCSHLNIWESLLATGDEREVVIVFEDDALLALPEDMSACEWFEREILPQLPQDWALCYLNEPFALAEHRLPRRERIPGPWTTIGAADDHPLAAYLARGVETSVPTTEAYAIRRSAAQLLVDFSVNEGWGAVDYCISKAFAESPELRRRLFIVEPCVASQPQRGDSDIQNWVLVGDREFHSTAVVAAMLRARTTDV